MSTVSSLSPVQSAVKPNPAQELATAFEISTGRILKVMVTSWSDGRISYRISVEQDGKLTIVHRLRDERQTTGINDLLWTLASGRWKMRPAYQGSGFIVFHGDYSAYIGRENPSL